MRGMSSIDLRHRSARDLVATVGPVVIRVVNGASTELEDVDRMRIAGRELLTHYPVIAILVIVEHGSPVPTPEVLRHMKRAAVEFDGRAVLAFALLGLGFWAAAALAVANGLGKVLGNAMLADTNLPALLDRLTLEVVGLDPQVLLQICEQLCAELAAGTQGRVGADR